MRTSLHRLIVLATLLAPALAVAQPVIIDHARDTRPYLAALKDRGVLAVGRYYARCVGRGQWDDKRMSVAEIDAFEEAGMAVLSIYQYWNNSKHKFDGEHVYGGQVSPTLGPDCEETVEGRPASEEGRLDAEAAVAQARAVGQPPGTAIYFGVDFDFPYEAAEKREYTEKMLSYFTAVKRILSGAGYRVGSYGNGYAHDTLLKSGLVELTWLSPSPAHSGSIDFYRSRRWNLFQANVDIVWFDEGDCQAMGLDTNIQNPEGPSDIGLWTRDGPFAIPTPVTRRVFDQMRFVCDAKANVRTPSGTAGQMRLCKSGKPKDYPDVPHGQSVAIGAEVDGMLAVDMDHNRSFDGWTNATNISRDFWERPKWVRRAPPVCQ